MTFKEKLLLELNNQQKNIQTEIQELEDIVSGEQFAMSTVVGGGPLASAAKEACRKRMRNALQKKSRLESRGTWVNEMLSKYK